MGKANVQEIVKKRREIKKYQNKDKKKIEKLIKNHKVEEETVEEFKDEKELELLSKPKNKKIVEDDEQDMNEDDDLVEMDGDDDDDQVSEDEEVEEKIVLNEKEKQLQKQKGKKEKVQPSKALETISDQLKQHKGDLAKLKEKDPELFKFLGENESELLEFGDDLSSDDGLDEDDISDLMEESDDEDLKDPSLTKEEKEKIEKKKYLAKLKQVESGGILTIPLIDAWFENCQEELTVRNLKKLITAFKSAAHTGTGENDLHTRSGTESITSSKVAFKINSSDVYDRILIICLQHIPAYFDQYLQYNSQVDESERFKLPHKTSKWHELSELVKSYLKNLIHLINQITDPKLTMVVLKGFEKVIPYVASFTGMSKSVLKVLLDHWQSSSESVRVIAFLCIRKLAIFTPYPFLDQCLKGIYLTYVKNSKFVNVESLPMINFMVNCVVEIFGLDFASCYRHAFVYIRQMAIHMRNTLNDFTKQSLQNIYNWLYINGLRAWGELLIAYPGQSELKELLFPVVQLLTGVIGLSNDDKFFPLRFHCIRLLNRIAQSTNTFINTLPYLLEILESSQFSKVGNHKAGSKDQNKNKHTNFVTNLSAPQSLIATVQYKDGVMAQFLEIIEEALYIHSHHIGFPELCIPVVRQLKKFAKTTKHITFSKQIKALIDAVVKTSTIIKQHRDKVKFAPKESKQVDLFTQQMKEVVGDKTPLFALLKAQREKNARVQEIIVKSRDTMDDQDYDNMDNEDESDESQDEDDLSEDDLDLEDDDQEDDEEEEEELEEDVEEKSRPLKKTKEHKKEDKSVDIVEDLELSDG